MKSMVHNAAAIKATVMNLKLEEDIMKSDKLVISVDEHIELADGTKFEMKMEQEAHENEEE